MGPLYPVAAWTIYSVVSFSSLEPMTHMCKERLSQLTFFKKQVPDIRDEETYGSDGVASVLDWKPPVSEGIVAGYPRKPILALSPQVGGS